MRKDRYIGLLLVVMTLFVGCTDQEAPKDVDEFVGTDFVFSVPDELTESGLNLETRGPSEEVWKRPQVQDVIIIPFKTQGTVGKDDVPAQHLAYSTWKVYEKNNARFYYNDKCQFVAGIASVLVYGRDERFGKTTAVIPSSLEPSGISFVPTQICATIDYDEKAQALADYLTKIATTPGWSTTTDSKLQALYGNYLGKKEGSVDYRVFGGSSMSVLGYVRELYTEVGLYESDAALANAIRANIATGATISGGVVTALSADLRDYPKNIGLPDGAAAVQWISGENKFVPQTTTTTIAPITSITRFAYPAELYFYGNSRISTSRYAVNTTKYETETIWNNVLQNYESGGVVDQSTQSVAVNTPIQYGMARLTTSLNPLPMTLIDGDGQHFRHGIDWNDNSFPMTGVVVGGQYPVGFDFRPETYSATPVEADMRYVYDADVKNGTTNTLVMQSYEGGKVIVVLELENRSGKKFKGKDAVVYPGAKFYLIGYVDPTVKTGSGDYTKRVFTRDYVTTLDMTVSEKGLANAYSVMPDLLAARMEVGVILVPKWDVITPTNVELF